MALPAIDLYLGLSSEQVDAWQRDGVLRAHWFGGTIPLKRTLVAAREAYQTGPQNWSEQLPPFIAKVTIASEWFLGLVNDGMLQVCLWVDGYRLSKDISVREAASFCHCEVFAAA